MRIVMWSVVLILLNPLHTLSQDSPDFTTSGFSMIGKLRYNLGEMMGQPFTAQNYTSVRGTPYLTDSFMQAVVTLSNGKDYWYDRIRLNLFTNQVHFMSPDGKEMVAGDGVVKKVIFFITPDSAHPLIYSSGYPAYSVASPYTFFEELNQGNYALLKQTSRTIVNDVGTSTTPMGQHFVDQYFYFIVDRKANQISRWKKGKESLVASLPGQQARIEQYTAEHRLSCRSAQEVAEVLQYLSMQK